jgi:hypothetical protein
MLYFLVTAMYPRFLITLDEELNSVPVTVRVGQVSATHNRKPRDIVAHFVRTGCRRRWPSRQTTDNFRVPDAPNASAAGYNRTSRVGYGGVHTVRTCSGGLCGTAEKPRMGEGG